MSFETWYLHKAEQCERMAADAAVAADRAKLKQEAKLWRDIARDIAKQDQAEFAKPYPPTGTVQRQPMQQQQQKKEDNE